MKKISFILIAAFAIGCSGKDDIKETPVVAPTAAQSEKLTAQLVGQWFGACVVNSDEGMSTISSFTFDADGTFVESAFLFLNTDCSGDPTDRYDSKGQFLISGVLTSLTYEVDFKYADAEEGDTTFVRLRLTTQSEKLMKVKVRVFKYIDDGIEKSVPSNYLEQLPTLDYFKL